MGQQGPSPQAPEGLFQLVSPTQGQFLLSDLSEEQKSSLHVGFVSASMLQSNDCRCGARNPPSTASSDTGFLHILQQIISPLCICGAGMKLLMSEHHNLGDKG